MTTAQCIKTRPESGPFNYLVCFQFAGKMFYFFINQKGEFLNSSYEGTWNKALKSWEPKPEIVDLPEKLTGKIKEIAGKIFYASKSNWRVKEYLTTGEKIINQEKVDFLKRKAHRKEQAENKKQSAEPVVKKVNGKTSYTSIVFEPEVNGANKKQPWWKNKKTNNKNRREYAKVG